jgi:hypothetical protein
LVAEVGNTGTETDIVDDTLILTVVPSSVDESSEKAKRSIFGHLTALLSVGRAFWAKLNISTPPSYAAAKSAPVGESAIQVVGKSVLIVRILRSC